MIAVVGTDHRLAPLEVRSVFSLTKEKMQELLAELRHFFSGAVILSTCNRIEVWVSSEKEQNLKERLLQTLCERLNLQTASVRRYFFYKENEAAADHLFRLSCGLESAILAEDQILTQVRHAREFAHDCGATDGTMELLFRTAVTGAKKVKTQVAFTRADASAVDMAIANLRKQGVDLSHSRCMVIGNGAYGRVAANALVRTGAEVLVTVRQYHSGRVAVPEGCRGIEYDERLVYLPTCDLVVSATASPHYTLQFVDLKEIGDKLSGRKPIYLIDLAVPPDIDPGIGELPSYILTNIDDYKSGDIAENKEAWKEANRILQEEEQQFWYLMRGRTMAPDVLEVEKLVEHDMHQRMEKNIRQMPLADTDKKKLTDETDAAARRTVNKLIFDLQDYVDDETFRKCVEGMKKIYE